MKKAAKLIGLIILSSAPALFAAKKYLQEVEIKYHGAFCYSFTGANGRVIMTDLFDPDKHGLDVPDVKPDILLVTHEPLERPYFEILDGTYQIIKSPGRFRVTGIEFDGIGSGSNIIFGWNLDGLNFVFAGNLEKFDLPDLVIQRYSNADVLFFPANEAAASNADEIWELLLKLGPKIIVFTGVSEYEISALKENEVLKKIVDERQITAEYSIKGFYKLQSGFKKTFDVLFLPVYRHINIEIGE